MLIDKKTVQERQKVNLKQRKERAAKSIVQNVGGFAFTLYGLINLTTYIASLYVDDDKFIEHFAYCGTEANFMQPFRALVASDRFDNVAGSATGMIIGGYFL